MVPPVSPRRSRSCALLGVILLLCTMGPLPSVRAVAPSTDLPDRHSRSWSQLIREAGDLRLPTGFLERIRPGFVTIDFEDLRSFAAEYHPAQHLMVLNRSLSLNAAGGVLRPLKRLTHREVATLYHELFHAYLDFLVTESDRLREGGPSRRLLAFARRQQACRYRQVFITPIRQRRALTEMRFLTEKEAWEALNETWAVFIEWVIWTTLHLREKYPGAESRDNARLRAELLRLLGEADRQGQLVGFYEPADPQERGIANKRYLAPSHRITPEEASLLLEAVLGESPEAAAWAAATMTRPEPQVPPLPGCQQDERG